MAQLEITFLEQTFTNPFLLEIPAFFSQTNLPFAEKYGGIIISAFPFEMKDEIFDSTSFAEKYLENVVLWRKTTDIPIIASIDGVVGQSLEAYCQKIEEAGANALHLRMFFLPDDRDFRSADYEKIFLETVAKISYSIRIPLVITLPVFFTNMFCMVEQLFYRGIQGFCPTFEQCIIDIDVEQFEYIHDNCKDMEINSRFYLKWISYFSTYFPRAHFTARLGQKFHYDEPIKYLLAGAHTVIEKLEKDQMPNIDPMINYLLQWMEKNSFSKVEHFQGQLNFQAGLTPSDFERKGLVDRYRYQFMYGKPT